MAEFIDDKETSVSPGDLVDLSNKDIEVIGDIRGLHRPDIKKLYLHRNLIKKIDNLSCATALVELNMSANLITEISNLESLVNLRVLVLSFNKISKIEHLDQLFRLRELNLSGNQINEIQGLENLGNLEILDLSINKIQTIQNLENLTELRELQLGSNQITTWTGFPALRNLTYLDLSLSSNRISDWEQLKTLKQFQHLRVISLKDNPIVSSTRGRVTYNTWIRTNLPQVTSLEGYKTAV